MLLILLADIIPFALLLYGAYTLLDALWILRQGTDRKGFITRAFTGTICSIVAIGVLQAVPNLLRFGRL